MHTLVLAIRLAAAPASAAHAEPPPIIGPLCLDEPIAAIRQRLGGNPPYPFRATIRDATAYYTPTAQPPFAS